MPCLSIKVNNGNQLYRPYGSQRLVLSDSHLIFDRTHLSDSEESLLCDYSMVIDYILEIKRQNNSLLVVLSNPKSMSERQMRQVNELVQLWKMYSLVCF